MSQRLLTTEILVRAYRSGVFPMAESRHRQRLYWVDPEWRGIIPLDRFHVPRRLRRTVRSGRFQVRCDTAFRAVIETCAEPGHNRHDTWITDEIIDAYTELFARGYAHSVESWEGAQLVGGLYGVSIGAAFFGESMFSRQTDASKVALVHLAARLALGGYKLLDTQFITEHLTQFGAIEIPRRAYRRKLAEALAAEAVFPRTLTQPRLAAYLQSLIQMS
jgi:leucyl/phenylalanyl-tRNA--protein transferase